MQSATNAFIEALRFGSTLVEARVTVYRGGTPTSLTLPVSNASFTADRNSDTRRQGQITLELPPQDPPQSVTIDGVNYGLLPLQPDSLLAPFGTEVSIALSVISPSNGYGTKSGDNGWVPMGLYQIASSQVSDSSIDQVITLDLYDRSWAVAQRSLLTAYNVPNTSNPYGYGTGADLGTQVKTLLATAWGGVPPWNYSIDGSVVSNGYTVPSGVYNQGQDPWKACLDMAASAGFQIFFDVNGNVVIKPLPDLSQYQTVVWQFAPNEVSAQGTLAHPIGGTPFTTPVAVSVAMTRDGVSNAWYVSATGPQNASGTATPIQQNALDTNPNSPTYINGGMGQVPTFVFDSLITSSSQAQAEATADLHQSIAKAWMATVTTPPNPLFDIDDVVTLTYPRLGLSNRPMIIDSISAGVRYDFQTQITGRLYNFIPFKHTPR